MAYSEGFITSRKRNILNLAAALAISMVAGDAAHAKIIPENWKPCGDPANGVIHRNGGTWDQIPAGLDLLQSRLITAATIFCCPIMDYVTQNFIVSSCAFRAGRTAQANIGASHGSRCVRRMSLRGRAMFKVLVAALVLIAGAGAAEAAPMTCADYDRPDVFANCRTNTDFNGRAQCCGGTADRKAACDVFHVHADSTAAAIELVNSTSAGRRAAAKDYAACMGKMK